LNDEGDGYCSDFEKLIEKLKKQQVLQELETFRSLLPKQEHEQKVVCSFLKHLVAFCPRLKSMVAPFLKLSCAQMQIEQNPNFQDVFEHVRPFLALLQREPQVPKIVEASGSI